MENKEILNFIHERDLHPVLNKFCRESLDIQTKTIYHEQSYKNKGKGEWLHPDMVGFQLTTSNWDSNIIDVCKNFYVSKAVLYSFELKKSITLDSLREYYFQAVSNSSWSNEGYLVTAYLDESNLELMNEIKRLVGAFGIGIIKLDILNPEKSSILYAARRKDVLDGETMNKLYSMNPNYQSFIQDIGKSLQINHIITNQWDSLKEYDKVKDKINTYCLSKANVRNSIKSEDKQIKTTEVVTKTSVLNTPITKNETVSKVNDVVKDDKLLEVTFGDDWKYINGIIPTIASVNQKIIAVSSWRDCYKSICEELYLQFGQEFINSALSIPYVKNKPFSVKAEDINKKALYLEKSNLYTEATHGGDGFMWILNRLKKVATFNMDIVVYGNKKFKDNVVREIRMDDKNIKLEYSKPIECIIEKKKYTGKNWYDLLLNIAIDLKSKDKILFEEYLNVSSIYTELDTYKDSYFENKLNLYSRPVDVIGKYKEIQKLLMVFDIDLSKCILKYEQKIK